MKYVFYVPVILLKILVLTACTQLPVTTDVPTDIKLSWESTTEPHPERSPWSKELMSLVKENIEKFKAGKDFTLACPSFNSLSESEQIIAISEFVVAVTYYESGFKPTSYMTEDLGIDKVTGSQVKSEGLLQLSYQDKLWAPWCAFDWAKDKYLKVNDPKKTIMDPIINLQCGVKIMANQVSKKGAFFPDFGYWAVTNRKNKNYRGSQIQARVKKYAPKCN